MTFWVLAHHQSNYFNHVPLISMISIRSPSTSRPTNFIPFSSNWLTYSGLTLIIVKQKKTNKKTLAIRIHYDCKEKKVSKWKNWIHLQPCHIEFCGSMQESQNHHKWFSLLNSLSYLISVPMSLFYKLCILVKLSWIKDNTNVRNL